jgi:hypothetical protein
MNAHNLFQPGMNHQIQSLQRKSAQKNIVLAGENSRVQGDEPAAIRSSNKTKDNIRQGKALKILTFVTSPCDPRGGQSPHRPSL